MNYISAHACFNTLCLSLNLNFHYLPPSHFCASINSSNKVQPNTHISTFHMLACFSLCLVGLLLSFTCTFLPTSLSHRRGVFVVHRFDGGVSRCITPNDLRILVCDLVAWVDESPGIYIYICICFSTDCNIVYVSLFYILTYMDVRW